MTEPEPGACGDPECHVLHADPANPIHPPWYRDSRLGHTHTAVSRYLHAWGKHENAPRTPCPECHFEQSAGYPANHAPGCSHG